MLKITAETLNEWNACTDGATRFNKLFPQGADLLTASIGLIEDNHVNWSNWLWRRCASDSRYNAQTVITAGDRGTATAGEDGVLSLIWLDAVTEKYRRSVSVVGENGVEPNVPYILDGAGHFVAKTTVEETSNA